VARSRKVPDLARVFAALGEKHRLTLIDALTRGDQSTSELATLLPVSLPAVMKHLRVLEKAQIVISRKSGRTVHFRLDPNSLRAIDRWRDAQRMAWEQRLDRLERFLADEDDA
jgi:DNA-binding transcriptional ArsR family regulator